MSTGDISVKFVGEVADYLRSSAERSGTTVPEVVAKAIALLQIHDERYD